MAGCVESSGGYMELSTTTLFAAAASTVYVAFKTTTGGATDEFRGVIGIRNITNSKQMLELYTFDAIDLRLFHKGTNGTTNVEPTVEAEDVPNSWRHFAVTVDSDGNPVDFYLLAEGYNQASPSYVYRNTDSTNGMYNQAGTSKLGVWFDAAAADEDVGNTIRIARVIVYPSAHSEAQILAQGKSRAPVHASPAVYYACTDTATLGTDLSGNARTATVTHSGSFSDVSDEPSDWIIDAAPLATFAAQRVNRNVLLRL